MVCAEARSIRDAKADSGQIYRWRQELRATPVSGFTPVLIATESPATNTEDGSRAVPAIELEFTGKVRVRIPVSVPPELAAAVVKALVAAMIPVPSGVRVWLSSRPHRHAAGYE